MRNHPNHHTLRAAKSTPLAAVPADSFYEGAWVLDVLAATIRHELDQSPGAHHQDSFAEKEARMLDRLGARLRGMGDKVRA